MSENGEKRQVTIITVHGTGDTAAGPDGEKWFQNGSAFVGRLKARLAAQGVEAEIVPHLWSGANSARGREAGANALAERLRKLRKTHDAIHLIGHSHGGNVANDAAVAVGWKGDACKSKVKSVTTVGTPFFRSEVGFAGWLASWVFLAFTVLSMFVMASVVALAIVMGAGKPPERQPPPPLHVFERMERDDAVFRGEKISEDEVRRRAMERLNIEEFAYSEMSGRTSMLTTGLFGAAIGLAGFAALLPVFRVARNGWRRVSRIRKRARTTSSVNAIWHSNDEAIAFLQRVETARLVAFPRGALWRGSNQVGVNTGVQVVILTMLAILTTAIAGALGFETIFGWNPQKAGDYFIGRPYNPETGETIKANPLLQASGLALLISPFLLPVIFGITYVFARMFFGVVPELFMRGWYNGVVGNALKGIAFGRDGDELIGKVSPRSHYFATQERVLDGDVAARMQMNSQGAASALIEKYRWSLFSVGGSDDTAIDALATDAMTWDSLIHTTYFDQPEVADMIADQIAGVAKAAC